MSKKKQESHDHEKSGGTSKAAAILIILCFLGIMPVLVWVTLPESSPYTTVTTSNAMVQVAAAASGLTICSQNGLTLKVPGVTSAVIYQLSPDCGSVDSSTRVQVLTVGFSDTASQNAAISSAMQTYQVRQGTDLTAFTSGYNVILVQGSATNPAVEKMTLSLTSQGATRIV